MPYTCTLEGRKWKLSKADGSKEFGTHDSKRACMKQMRAIYANEISNNANLRLEGFLMEPPDLDYKISQAQDTITVVVSGEGGLSVDAISIHNKLRSSGKKVIVYVPSIAYSAHAIVMLAGDEIYAAENSLIMFHPPAIQLSADTIKNAEELKVMVDRLEAFEKVLTTTLMARTNKSEDECKKIMGKESYLTADEALALGVIDEVIPIMRTVSLRSYFPERIVNFVKGKELMPLKEVCSQFGLTVNDENAEEKLVEYINSLKGSQKPEQKKVSEVSDSLLNMVLKARETTLNALVSEGKIIPAVATALKTRFVTKEVVKDDIATGKEKFDFDDVIDALGKNETVVSFNPKTGVQTLDKQQQKEQEGFLANLWK